MKKIKDMDERKRETVKALKAELERVRVDVNAAVVDYAKGYNRIAQREMRSAIDNLDRMIQMQLNDEAYMSL